MRSAVDVSHFDIFETADFSEVVQKRPFYKYCDLEINSHFIFLLQIVPRASLTFKSEKAMKLCKLSLSLQIRIEWLILINEVFFCACGNLLEN